MKGGIIMLKAKQIISKKEWGLIKVIIINGIIFWMVNKIVIKNQFKYKDIMGIQKWSGAPPIFKIKL